jgi:hypothetical protein
MIQVDPAHRLVALPGSTSIADIEEAIRQVTGKKRVRLREWTIYVQEDGGQQHFAAFEPPIGDLGEVHGPLANPGRVRVKGFR